MPKTVRSRPQKVVIQQSGVTWRIVSAILGAVGVVISGYVLFMLEHWSESNQKNTDTLKTISIELPHIQTDVKSAAEGVQNLRQTNVTRDELTNKHNRLQDNINEKSSVLQKSIDGVHDEVKDVRSKEEKLQDKMEELMIKPTPKK